MTAKRKPKKAADDDRALLSSLPDERARVEDRCSC
jgi:hypothetical protein